MRSAFVLAALLCAPSSIFAAEPLTLAAALEQVSSRNPELEAARCGIEALEGKALQAAALSNPELGLSMQEIPFKPLGTAESSREISLDQTLEPGKKRSYRRAAVRSEVEAAKEQFRALEAEILLAAKKAYWTLSLARQNAIFAGDELEFQQRFLARVEDRYRSGQARTVELAQARLEAARAARGLEAARKDEAVAATRLNLLMGLDLKTPAPSLAPPQAGPYPLDEEKLARAAMAVRPELGVLAAELGGGKAEAELARRSLLYPDLKAGLVYQNGSIAPGVGSWGARLGLTLPVFYRYRGEKAAAAAKLRELAARRKAVERAILAEVRAACLEAGSLAAQLALSRQALDHAVEAARLSEQAYLDGKEDILLFIQARRELAAARLSYIGTLNDYQIGLAELEKAAGIPLEEVNK